MKPDATPLERFTGWFAVPIEKLKELPEGDGAFAALMIALPLYERYITAKLKLEGRPTGEEDKRRAIGTDLQLSDSERSIFWEMFRNGFTHQCMIRTGKTKWVVSHRFGGLPEFRTYKGKDYVCVDPWKFADRVVKAFKQDPRLITASDSYPLAGVFVLPADAFAGEKS